MVSINEIKKSLIDRKVPMHLPRSSPSLILLTCAILNPKKAMKVKEPTRLRAKLNSPMAEAPIFLATNNNATQPIIAFTFSAAKSNAILRDVAIDTVQ